LRSVYKIGEYEEIDSAIQTIIQNINIFPRDIQTKINKNMIEMSKYVVDYGVEEID